jgi:hypothetical protein
MGLAGTLSVKLPVRGEGGVRCGHDRASWYGFGTRRFAVPTLAEAVEALPTGPRNTLWFLGPDNSASQVGASLPAQSGFLSW